MFCASVMDWTVAVDDFLYLFIKKKKKIKKKQYGNTALISASYHGYTNIVDYLLKHGANTNHQDKVQLIKKNNIHTYISTNIYIKIFLLFFFIIIIIVEYKVLWCRCVCMYMYICMLLCVCMYVCVFIFFFF